MTFSDWVVAEFGERGISRAAAYLGFNYNTVFKWFHYDRFPYPKNKRDVVRKSGNKICADAWEQKYLVEREKKEVSA